MNTKISLGADPELMLMDTVQGKIVNALKVIGRNKEDPVMLPCGEKYYADNVLFEFSVKPAATATEAADNIKTSLSQAARLLPDHSFVAQAAHVFDADELKDKSAWEIGCTPSFNAWTESMTPASKYTDNLRTGSFHIHIGSDNLMKIRDKIMYIRLLDVYLGCASVLFDKDSSVYARRKLYGKAGEFRSTPYGLEYRVLGNYVLRNRKITEFVFNLAGWVVLTPKSEAVSILSKIGATNPQIAINEGDKKIAMEVLKMAGTPDRIMADIMAEYPEDLNKAWGLA